MAVLTMKIVTYSVVLIEYKEMDVQGSRHQKKTSRVPRPLLGVHLTSRPRIDKSYSENIKQERVSGATGR